MVKICSKCGIEYADDTMFCSNCGLQVEEKYIPPVVPQPQIIQQPQQPMTIQPIKKSKTPLIVGVIVVVLAIAFIMGFFLIFSGSQDDAESQNDAVYNSGQFVGSWDEEYQVGVSNSNSIWTFYDDGTVKMVNNQYSSVIWNDYETNGDMICLSSNEYSYYHCYDVTFKEGESKLVLSAAGVNSIILTKI